MQVVTREQMQFLEQSTIKRLGLSSLTLMESAGRSVSDFVQKKIKADKINKELPKVIVLTGPGNNGGDGMVAARYLHNLGMGVSVFLTEDSHLLKNESQTQYQALKQCKVFLVEGGKNLTLWEQELLHLSKNDIIIDALFGVGLKKPLEGFYQKLVTIVNQSQAFVLSVDIPSGLDANQGVFPGLNSLPTIVKADATITFAFPKVGMVHSPGFSYVGRLEVADIGIPSQWLEEKTKYLEEKSIFEPLFLESPDSISVLDKSCVEPLFHPKNPLGHKGTHGHLAILAGSIGKTGAALLTTLGATQTGVGLCTLLVPQEIMESVQGRILEAMTASYQLPIDPQMKILSKDLEQNLRSSLQEKQAWVIGPGIPKHALMKQVLWHVLGQGTSPVVLDADALNEITHEESSALKSISSKRSLILTPHPGEAARLLKTTSASIQENRMQSALKLYHETGATIVLKGARTLIVGIDESCSQKLRVSICPTGNAAMGTGGMGDVLSGMIGALLAQGIPSYQAACMAVYLHGFVGDRLQAKLTPDSLLQASRLAYAIPNAKKALFSSILV